MSTEITGILKNIQKFRFSWPALMYYLHGSFKEKNGASILSILISFCFFYIQDDRILKVSHLLSEYWG